MKKLETLFCLLAVTVAAVAQSFSVYGKLEPSKIVIGDQTKLSYELTQDKSERVSCPVFSDTITKGVELVETLKPDTIDLGGGRIQVKLDYMVTAFDSGFYFIPAQKFVSINDSVQSKPLGLLVDTVETGEQAEINPVKDIMDPPFLWSEFFYWAGIVLLVLLIVALIIYMIMRERLNKKLDFVFHREEPAIPPYQIALQQLEEVKSEKAWQSGDIKAFYTRVTDIMREYMMGQFSINAMELTTDEILALTKKNPEFEQVRQILKEVLELSDLVKFAKFIPLEDENNRSMLNAFAFVEKTMPQPEPEADKAGAEAGTDGKEAEK
ncbi:MAG: hypothetical protein J6P34_01755 [Paludibacteraceae bacterium]|nr:hypothetical protein [Paludibacteraceae bacterium]MBO7367489.1 hypothetical protein [Paludibacteraceae bacterium]